MPIITRRFPHLIQPQTPVRLDPANRLASGISWVSQPHPQTGEILFPSGTRAVSGRYQGINSTSNTNGGAAYEQTGTLKQMGNQSTVMVLAKITTLVDWSMILGVPHNNGAGWPDSSSKYLALGLQRYASAGANLNKVRFVVDGAAGASDFIAATHLVETSDQHVLYGCSRDGASARFIKNRSVEGTSLASAATSPDYQYNGKIVLLNRSYANQGEGIVGHCALAVIWNRALSDAEMLSFYDNPWQIFEPLKRNIYVEAAASGATLIELTTATFSWTKNAIQNRALVTLSAPTLRATAQSIQNRSTLTASLASLKLVGQSIQNRAAVTLTAAALSFLAKALQHKLTIVLTVASFSFIAWAINVTGAAALIVARLLSLLGVGS